MEEGKISFDQTDDNQGSTIFNWEEWLFDHKWTAIFLLIGILLLGVGILSTKTLDVFKDDTKVEVLGDASEVGNEKGVRGGEIVVEIAGEVQKPGVYHLSEGDRVSDLLVLAGGLSANADREYVSKNINQAQMLADGVKVYIPEVGEVRGGSLDVGSGSTVNSMSGINGVKGSGIGVETKININTATIADLDRLWGIGEVTAKKIIENRPYQKPEELLSKKIIKENVWEAIKDKVTVW